MKSLCFYAALLCFFLALSPITVTGSSCPSDKFVYGKFFGIPRCYSVYKAETLDHCSYKDICKPFNDKATPAVITSKEEQKFMLSNVLPVADPALPATQYHESWVLLGEHEPCKREQNNSCKKSEFCQPDGSEIFYPAEQIKTSGAIFLVLSTRENETIAVTQDQVKAIHNGYFGVVCSITLPHCPQLYFPLEGKDVSDNTTCLTAIMGPDMPAKPADYCQSCCPGSTYYDKSNSPKAAYLDDTYGKNAIFCKKQPVIS